MDKKDEVIPFHKELHKEQEEEEKKKKKDYSLFKEGDSISGYKIKEIFYFSKNYIIYTPKEYKNKVVYDYNDKKICISVLSPISAKITEICGLKRKLKNKSKYNSAIASAFVECFDGNSDKGLEILEKIEKHVKNDFINDAKIDYLTCTILFILINTIISMALYYTNNYANYGVLKEYFYIATFGSYGGFLSTILKVNKLNFKDYEYRNLLCFLSVSRVFLSMLSSVIIYILIKSNLLIGIANNANNVYVFYIFAVVAGYSETFIPDILTKIESNSTQEQQNNAPRQP
jgi:hypothetical protein